MLKRTLAVLIALLMIAAVFAGCKNTDKSKETAPPSAQETAKPGDSGGDTQPKGDKESIVFGGVRSQSGVFATFDETLGPIYRMGRQGKRGRRQTEVEEYGKKLPVELIIYDDKSIWPQ